MDSPNTAPDTIDAQFDESEPRAPEVVEPMREDPPPELVEAVVRHYVEARADLQRRVASIEAILGFIHEADDARALAVRVAKLEAFVGIKG